MGGGAAFGFQPLVEAPMSFRLASGGPKANDTLVSCPNCGAPAFIRRSMRLTEIVKTMTCHCTNTACAMTFEAEIVATRVFSPGGCLRPDLGLPVTPREQVPHIFPPAGKHDPDQPSMFDPDTG